MTFMILFVEESDAMLQGTRKVVIKTKRKDVSDRDIVKLINSKENKSCGAIIKKIEDGDGHISIDKNIQSYLNLKENDEIAVEKIEPPEAEVIKLEGLGKIYGNENIKEIVDEIKKTLIGKPVNKGIEINVYRQNVKINETIPDQIVIVRDTTRFDISEKVSESSEKNKASSMSPFVSNSPWDTKGTKIVPIERPNINFEDVGGLDDVKEKIRDAIVYPFEHPDIYKEYGKKAGEGILLYGPPGCGKTFIAKAAAGECKASFLSIKISDILGPYVGESERNLKSVFESANENRPCIIFFDEIDGIGGRRDNFQEHSKRLVSELLTQMDGIEKTDDILILAATNAPWAVDPALRRPGRFTKLIMIPPPDSNAREEIFRIHTKRKPVESDLDFEKLAIITEGYSAADIKQLCIDATDIPLKEAMKGEKKRKIGMEDFKNVMKNRTPSLIPWFRHAREQIASSGEQDIFKELLDIINKYNAKNDKLSNKKDEDIVYIG